MHIGDFGALKIAKKESYQFSPDSEKKVPFITLTSKLANVDC